MGWQCQATIPKNPKDGTVLWVALSYRWHCHMGGTVKERSPRIVPWQWRTDSIPTAPRLDTTGETIGNGNYS